METTNKITTRARERRAASVPLPGLAGLAPSSGVDLASAFTTQTRWTVGGRKGAGTSHGRALKYMTCRFCKHEELFNIYRKESHLASCEKYQEARRRDAERREEAASRAPDPSPPSASANEIMVEFQMEADDIRSKRFAEVEPVMRPFVTKLQDLWAKYWPAWQDMLRRADDKVSQLREQGHLKEAEELARAIRSVPKMHYSQFFVDFDVPLGREVLTVRGLDPLRLRESDLARWRELDGEPDAGLSSVPIHEVEKMRQEYETTIREQRSQHESWVEDQLDNSRTAIRTLREQHKQAIETLEGQKLKTQEKVDELRERVRILLADRHTANDAELRAKQNLRKCLLSLKGLNEKYVRANFDLTQKDQHISDLDKWSEDLQKKAEARREDDFFRIEEKLRGRMMNSMRKLYETSNGELAGLRAQMAELEAERDALEAQLAQAGEEFQAEMAEMQAASDAEKGALQSQLAQSAEELQARTEMGEEKDAIISCLSSICNSCNDREGKIRHLRAALADARREIKSLRPGERTS